MKYLVTLIVILFTNNAYSQSPFQRQYDSLSKVTKKQILGYSKAYHGATLTTTIWYRSFHDYHDEATWSVVTLDSATIKRAYDSIARKTGKWVTGYTHTFYKRRETVIIKHLVASGEEKYDIEYTVER